jgi:hypothetical protein
MWFGQAEETVMPSTTSLVRSSPKLAVFSQADAGRVSHQFGRVAASRLVAVVHVVPSCSGGFEIGAGYLDEGLRWSDLQNHIGGRFSTSGNCQVMKDCNIEAADGDGDLVASCRNLAEDKAPLLVCFRRSIEPLCETPEFDSYARNHRAGLVL